jgi:hypothetical protein
MIRKACNKSITNETIYNTKPAMSNYNFELNLHSQNKVRQIRDCATDAFVASLFSYDYLVPANNQKKSIKRNLFLLFVYDYFNLNIISDFDIYLMNNDCELIISDEYIKFLFKGGNVYFEIIHRLIYEQNILDVLSQTAKDEMNNFFKRAFSVSDFDFTVSIKCLSNEKFIKIKYHLTNFLIKRLEEITLFFNSYLIKTLSPSNNYINTTYNGSELTFTHKQTGIDQNILNIPNLNTHNIQLLPNEQRIMTRLKLIDNLFYSIYNNPFFYKFLNAIKNNVDQSYNIQNILSITLNNSNGNKLLEHYSIIISPFEKEKIKLQLKKIINNIRLINRILTNQEFNNLNPIDNKYFNSKIINTISKLEYINTKFSPTNIFIYNSTINLITFKTYQSTYFNNLQKCFDQVQFYSPEIFSNIINSLVATLNTKITSPNNIIKNYVKDPKELFLFQNKNDYQDESNFEIINLKRDTTNNITTNDISITGTPDILYQVNNTEKILFNNDENNNYHYISYNSSINSNLSDINSITNFDLLRSKFNFSLSNIYIKKFLPDAPNNWKQTKIKIPSEFIDISICCFDDTMYNHLMHDSSYYQTYNLIIPVNNLTNKRFSVESFNTSYYIHDLSTVLFTQNHLTTPWLDAKYSKRLERLFFIYAINNKIQNYRFLTLINTIASDMIVYINNPTPVTLANINIYSEYDFNNNDFILLSNNIINHHKNIKDYKFAIDNLYYKGLDDFIDVLFFVFNVYYYNNVNTNLMFNLVNYLRKKFKYYDFNNTEYITHYINKIQPFLEDVRDKSADVIKNIGRIYINLRNI